MPAFTFDTNAQRFRAPNGRFVPEAAIRAEVQHVTRGSSDRLASLTRGLVDGTLDLPSWQQQAMAEIKSVHVATATAAKGGHAQMAPSDYGYVGSRVKAQYEYLRGFAADVASGKQPLDGRAVNRARLYGAAAVQTYGEQQRRNGRQRGAEQERRIINSQESCSGCVEQADLGWQPVGTLAPLGSQLCLSHCLCSWETRTVPVERAA